MEEAKTFSYSNRFTGVRGFNERYLGKDLTRALKHYITPPFLNEKLPILDLAHGFDVLLPDGGTFTTTADFYGFLLDKVQIPWRDELASRENNAHNWLRHALFTELEWRIQLLPEQSQAEARAWRNIVFDHTPSSWVNYQQTAKVHDSPCVGPWPFA